VPNVSSLSDHQSNQSSVLQISDLLAFREKTAFRAGLNSLRRGHMKQLLIKIGIKRFLRTSILIADPPFDFDCTSVPPSSANDVKPMAVHHADAESCVTPIIAEDAGVDFGGDDAISIISVAARSLFFWFGE